LKLVKGLVDGALRVADGLWNGVKGTAETLLKGLSGGADALFKTIEGGLQRAKGMATGLWNGLTGRVPSVLKKLPAWSLIERGWNALSGTLEAAATKVIETAKAAWKGIEKRATDLWKTVDQEWTAFRNAAAKRAKDMVDGIQRVVSGLASSAIEKVIGVVTKFAHFLRVPGRP